MTEEVSDNRKRFNDIIDRAIDCHDQEMTDFLLRVRFLDETALAVKLVRWKLEAVIANLTIMERQKRILTLALTEIEDLSE